MRGMIARLLQRRDRPIFLGLCEPCRTKVYADDDYVRTSLGYAHRDCQDFRAGRRGAEFLKMERSRA